MNHEWFGVILGVLTFLGALLATVIRVSWVVSTAISVMKSEFNALLTLKEAEFDSKIGRVYQRFDEYKTCLESSFIRKEMCDVVHNSTAVAMMEVVKRLDKVETKIDALLVSRA